MRNGPTRQKTIEMHEFFLKIILFVQIDKRIYSIPLQETLNKEIQAMFENHLNLTFRPIMYL